jgi:hypothetical protein
MALNSITVNGSTVASSSTGSIHGSDINSYNQIFDDINLAENIFDTYIGGDNDANGYYWDYDGTNTVVRKNTTDNPITFALTGAGTSVNPYIINNSNDLRQASTKQNVYYKLAADIDMSGQHFYMLGSYINKMTGNFNGGAHTINGIYIDAPTTDYIGFVGYLNGYSSKITAINLTNIDITGSNYTAGVVGYANESKVTEMSVQGNITGTSNVGMLVGRAYCSGALNVTITSNVIEGNVTGVSNVGGAVGGAYNASGGSSMIAAVYKSGSVTATGSNYGRIVGYVGGYIGAPNPAISAMALNSITVNGSTVASSSTGSIHGKDIVSGDLSNSATYTEIGFNFTDEALDYIWYIDGPAANFREGSL